MQARGRRSSPIPGQSPFSLFAENFPLWTLRTIPVAYTRTRTGVPVSAAQDAGADLRTRSSTPSCTVPGSGRELLGAAANLPR